jgi:hypothetical protein
VTGDELLRRHAPILRFDARELFIPTAVDAYVESSTLWDEGRPVLLRPTLAELDGRWAAGTYLRFVSDEERRSVVREEVRLTARRLLSHRLGRVGLFGRVLDALFILALLFRPTTPRLTIAAAAVKAERLGLHRKPTCYGRVVRSGEWLVLHYAYFYVMNDWRTSYRGLNDHEADWEQVWVFVDPVTSKPVWVAGSSHEHSGDDLRRHWDDPELIIEGDRPVLFPGAGSHAVYFSPGDYVTRLDVPSLRWLLRLQRWTHGMLRIRDEAAEQGLGPALGAPFVDSATGDGRAVSDWDLRPMNDGDTPWLGSFRGLWGLDTGDRTGGERGPGGPKFARNGQIRASWADPVGFAGLHGTPPPQAAGSRINLEKLDRALGDLDEEIRRYGRLLPLAGQTGRGHEPDAESRHLTELLRRRAELQDLRRDLVAGRVRAVTLRGHLRRPAVPLPPPAASGWILAFWAAASVPLLLLALASLFLIDEVRTLGVVVVGGAVAVLLEQAARRRVQAVLRLLVVGVGLVLFFAFAFGLALTVSRYAAGAALVVGAVLLFVVNLSELRAVQQIRSRQVDAATRR